MIYLATPYTHPDPNVEHQRYLTVSKFAARMLVQEFIVFSPITYGHTFKDNFGLKGDAGTWMKVNLGILRHCEAMYILKQNGWQESKGLHIEMNCCKMLGIPTVSYRSDGPDFILDDPEFDNIMPGKF